MLFPARMHEQLRDGSITVTFRRWKRPQARVGGRYRTGGGDLVVESIDTVLSGMISDADARRAGFSDAGALRRELRWPDDAPVYRIAFHREDPAPPPAWPELDDAELDLRLDRLDAASPVGPWTRSTLRMIAERPATRAADLAAALGRKRLEFKADVRKLKRLGLTESLEVGYRLSSRGRAYLDRR